MILSLQKFKAMLSADSLKTIYWFNYLYQQLHARSALAVQRAIDPESIQTSDGKEVSHSSKWAEYRRGQHKPRPKIIEKAEAKVPGSSAKFNHALWIVLKDVPISKHAVSMIKTLDASLQPILFDIHGRLISNANGHFLRKLERRASLDTLAALTILLKLNLEAGSSEIAWEYAHSTTRVLLIIGKQLDEYGMAEDVYKIYCRDIFPSVSKSGSRFFTRHYLLLLILSFNLDQAMLKWSEPQTTITAKEQSRIKLNLIYGIYSQSYNKLFSN